MKSWTHLEVNSPVCIPGHRDQKRGKVDAEVIDLDGKPLIRHIYWKGITEQVAGDDAMIPRVGGPVRIRGCPILGDPLPHQDGQHRHPYLGHGWRAQRQPIARQLHQSGLARPLPVRE